MKIKLYFFVLAFLCLPVFAGNTTADVQCANFMQAAVIDSGKNAVQWETTAKQINILCGHTDAFELREYALGWAELLEVNISLARNDSNTVILWHTNMAISHYEACAHEHGPLAEDANHQARGLRKARKTLIGH